MKKNKQQFHLTPQLLSWLLISAIVLMVIAAGVANWFLQQVLSQQAVAADHAKIDAELGQSDIQRSKTLQTYLDTNKATIEKTYAVVADTKTYEYQNQIVEDIESYAAKAGVGITGFTFPTGATAPKVDATGLKTVTATLTLRSPVEYTRYITFLKYVEQNVTRMQITDISLTPSDKNPQLIDSTSIGLKVYVR